MSTRAERARWIVREQPTHTIIETPCAEDGSSISATINWTPACHTRQACGGRCVLAWWHVGPCECGGDEPGEPGSCPA